MKKTINYAFIDANNLIFGLKQEGWKINYEKFRIFLRDKYRVKKAFWFLGYISKNENFYKKLKNVGFELIFKKIVKDKTGKIKGNIDSLLIVKCFRELEFFDKAILISGDGDFEPLINFLIEKNKFEKLILPNKKSKSCLLNKHEEFFLFLSSLKKKLQYKNVG